jgi:hypothetical protein
MSAIAVNLAAPMDTKPVAAPDPAPHGGLPSTGAIDVPTNVTTGLTASEVTDLKARGQGNTVEAPPGRTYGQIIRENLFTFLNCTLYGIGGVLVVLGLYRDALLSSGFGFLNAAIGVVQESIAKRRLDQVALLARAQATVLRDGKEVSVSPEDLVLGDILVLKAGDQAVIDGVVVESSQLSMDESLLTGEADAIPKAVAGPIYAGRSASLVPASSRPPRPAVARSPAASSPKRKPSASRSRRSSAASTPSSACCCRSPFSCSACSSCRPSSGATTFAIPWSPRRSSWASCRRVSSS